MRGVAARQVVLAEGFTGNNVGQRDLGRGDEPHAFAGLVAVLGELWQLVGAVHGLVPYQNGRDGFRQAVFSGVRVEHELCERAVHTGDGAGQEYKAAAGEFGGRFKVHAAFDAFDLVMLFRLEIERGRCAPAADFDVIVFVCAFGNVRVGAVWERHQEVAQLGVEVFCDLLLFGHGLFFVGNFGAEAFECGVVSRRFGRTDLFGGGVGFGLHRFGGLNGGAALFVDSEDVRRRAGNPKLGHVGVKSSGVFADCADIVHLSCPCLVLDYEWALYGELADHANGDCVGGVWRATTAKIFGVLVK